MAGEIGYSGVMELFRESPDTGVSVCFGSTDRLC